MVLGAACILASIGSLVISEVNHWWLVQAVVRLGTMGSVMPNQISMTYMKTEYTFVPKSFTAK